MEQPNVFLLSQGDKVYCERLEYTATEQGLEVTKYVADPNGYGKLFAVRKQDNKMMPLSGNELISYQGEGYLFAQTSPMIENQHQLVWDDGMQLALNKMKLAVD